MKKCALLFLLLFSLTCCLTFDPSVRSFNGSVYYFNREPVTKELIISLKELELPKEDFAIYLEEPYYAAESSNNEIVVYKITDKASRKGIYFVVKRNLLRQ